jgi:hypothetical protein
MLDDVVKTCHISRPQQSICKLDEHIKRITIHVAHSLHLMFIRCVKHRETFMQVYRKCLISS